MINLICLVYLIGSNLVEEYARAGVRTQGVPHEKQVCCQVHYTSMMYNYRSLHSGHGSCFLCILCSTSTLLDLCLGAERVSSLMNLINLKRSSLLEEYIRAGN